MRNGAGWCARPARPLIKNHLLQYSLLACLTALAAASGPSGAQETIPTFAELEAAGARIGEIRVIPQDMFDLEDPRENTTLYRLANKLHINTREVVIRRALLFRTGEPVSVRLIEETERLLRANRYLYDVAIRPIAYRDGVADIEVKTRDTWSLEPGISVSRAGGRNTGRLSLEEDNLLGTGISVGLQYRKDIDRSGTQFHIADHNLLGTRNVISYSYANQDDGNSQSFSFSRPFYALDTRWAAGVDTSTFDGAEAIYNGGNLVAEYTRRHARTELFGGWSSGLIRGWTRRYSVGFLYDDSDYDQRPGKPPPERLPADLTISAPFARFELLEDAFRKDTNLNQIGRIEDITMGVQSKVQLGRSLTRLGATRDLWVYDATASSGFDVTAKSFLLTTVGVAGRYGGANGSENQSVGGSARYYHRQGTHIVYYASVAADMVEDPDAPGPLLLGGDSGLRGYPLRYQAGERRALMTLEVRGYTDWYPLRLIRVGGALFYDVGRAWRGENQNTANPGWLQDVGFGLRFLNARSAFGQVLHADFAFPLTREGDIRPVQFVLKTKVAL
jgi:outer membrane protein assembly factor BamA